jgi:hypothetical protein
LDGAFLEVAMAVTPSDIQFLKRGPLGEEIVIALLQMFRKIGGWDSAIFSERRENLLPEQIERCD